MTAISLQSFVPTWAEHVPGIGPAVYKLTSGPNQHKHTYHLHSPWSTDCKRLLLFRYSRQTIIGEICIMDLATGDMNVIGQSTCWTDHMGAGQQWQGALDRVLYCDRNDHGRQLVSASADGGGKQVFQDGIIWHHCTPDGRYLLGRSTMKSLFPDDRLSSREDKGIFKLDTHTGRSELLISAADVLAQHPDSAMIKPLHLYLKQIKAHPHLDRFFFVFGNGDIFRAYKEARVHTIYAANLDGSCLTYMGEFAGHPTWHPTDDVIMANAKDDAGTVRYTLYRRAGTVEHIPGLIGDGHPSYSPDSRYICTDRYHTTDAGRTARVVVADTLTGSEYTLAEFDNPGHKKAFSHVLETRAEDRYIVDAMSETGQVDLSAPWVTEAHPAWSRDGRQVIFNCDETGSSQLYIVDMAQVDLCDRPKGGRHHD